MRGDSEKALRQARFWLLVVFGLATAASAKSQADQIGSERVFVLDLVDSGAGDELTARTTAALRDEVTAVIGNRHVVPSDVSGKISRPALAKKMHCPLETQVKCATAVGQELEVQFVVAGTVAALGDAQIVDLRLVDIKAQSEIGRLQSDLGPDVLKNQRILRELSVRLVAPEAYVGTLMLNDLEISDKLLVDGLEIEVVAPSTQTLLPVGQHAVEVMRSGVSKFSEVVEIHYDETRLLSVEGTVEPQTTTELDVPPATAPHIGGYPFWIAMGISGVSVIVATGLLVHTFVWLVPSLEEAEASKVDGSVCSSHYSEEPSTQCYVEDAEYARNSIIAEAVGVATLVVIGVASAVIGFLYANSAEELEEPPEAVGQ